MDNKTGSKSDIFELESLRSELIEKIHNTFSVYLRLFLFKNYFEKILSTKKSNLVEAFISEFFDNFISDLSKFDVWGVDPLFTESLLSFLQELNNSTLNTVIKDTLKIESDRISQRFLKLKSILEGRDVDDDDSPKASFPLIDYDSPQYFYGLIDSITVKINESKKDDKFIIIPSEIEIEKKLIEQCKVSWELALNLSKDYIKRRSKYHDVIISFDKKIGFYEGNSLGIALTLSFLEQLLKFYNSTYLIKLKHKIAFTGGVIQSGEVLCTGEEIIKTKVAAVFFSDVRIFVIPKFEESYAYFALTQLKNIYPERKLKLIPVETISDILNRRDVVEIKKRNPILRTGKFVADNWKSVVFSIILTIVFSILFILDLDDNPALLSIDNNTLFIKNKNNKILWIKKVAADMKSLNSSALITDVNNDNKNDVLICNMIDTKSGRLSNQGAISCYDSKGNELWKYEFKDIVKSNREVMNIEYSLKIIDTSSHLGIKSLFLSASNAPSFGSAIFRLDLTTGKRLPGTFWASGHIMNATIKDIDQDKKVEIIGVGYDNGFEDLVFFVFEADTINKVRPTTEEYLIRDYPPATMKYYIRFPKTDFDNYFELRTPVYVYNSFIYDDTFRKFSFVTAIPRTIDDAEVSYEIDYNMKNVNVVIDSDFRVRRDTLVAHGKLKPPYTDTEEYKEILKSKILYWKDGNWVKREEFDE